jgi:hypothetical protein
MKVKDLQVGTAYATCDGQRITFTEAGLQKVWWQAFKNDKVVKVGEIDPWGGCIRDPGVRGAPKRLMLKGTVTDVDRDGEPLTSGKHDRAVNPSDIKGTWLEFMMLHGARVRQEADRRSAAEWARQLQTSITAKVTKKFPGHQPSMRGTVINDSVYRGRDGKYEPARYIQVILVFKSSEEAQAAGIRLTPEEAAFLDNAEWSAP